MEELAESYERQVSELADVPSVNFTHLEGAYDQEAAENGEVEEETRSTNSSELVDQIEQFFRDQRS
ncbi:MAG: hypothetical protein OXF99_00720 [bacterium]|nr:hypothetical protein [bacterium]